jgi:murein L,D-transpeptidase YcbB/YkuD
LQQARQEYRCVLDDWNDNLNRTLALAEISFGKKTKDAIAGLQEEYASIGRALNIALRQELEQASDPVLPPRVGYARRLKQLSNHVYLVNIAMLSALSDGTLPSVIPDAVTARSTLSIGDQGTDVRTLQSALRLSGYELAADGAFGLETHRAVSSFQQTHGLPDDGIAGPATRALMSPSG